MRYHITQLTTIRVAIVEDAVTTPDGGAGRALVADTALNSHLVTSAAPLPVLAGHSYRFEALLKPAAQPRARLSLAGPPFAAGSRADFDLLAGTVASVGAAEPLATIVPGGGGWYRVAVEAPVLASGNAQPELYPVSESGPGFAGDGVTHDLYFADLLLGVRSMRERVLDALAAVLSGVSADVRRDEVLPVVPPPGGLVNIRHGDVALVGQTLSPVTYDWQHDAQLECIVTTGDVAQLDALLIAVALAVRSDPTLGGIVDHAEPLSPRTQGLAIEGAETLRGALVPVRLFYTTDYPLI